MILFADVTMSWALLTRSCTPELCELLLVTQTINTNNGIYLYIIYQFQFHEMNYLLINQ